MIDHDEIKMVIVVRRDLNMRKGKMSSQVGHASMKFITDKMKINKKTCTISLSDQEIEWLTGATPKIVVSCENEEELIKLMQQAFSDNVQVHKIIDSGRTEFHGVPTVSCAAFGPEKSSKLNKITGALKLL